VPHVLRVPALEIGDPMALLILVEADDTARHAAQISAQCRL